MDVEEGKTYEICGYICGRTARSKFITMGLNIGRKVKIVTVQPLHGPYVVSLNGNKLSVGRGLFEKLLLEEVND